MEKKQKELKERLLEIYDLNSAAMILSWDQSTYMPPASAPSRGRQMATHIDYLSEKYHALYPAAGLSAG